MMYLPPPQPALDREIRVSGDVEIHPTASIAPGVILQAAPQSRIVISADACIGMGVIINACQGIVEIGMGSILGSGVLIIGNCKIGNNSCIGTSTTIFNDDVAAMSVIEPGSIIGDISRQAKLQEHRQTGEPSQSKSPKSHFNGNSNAGGYYYSPSRQEPQNKTKQEKKSKENKKQSTVMPEVETTVEPLTPKTKNPVVGQVYINELLVTLFPHKKGTDSDSQNLSK